MDMLVDDYTMVVKGLDQITEAAAKTLLETIVEQVGGDLNASIVDIWQTQEGRDGIILNPLLCTENGQRRDAAPFQITDATRGMFAWVVKNGEPVCLHGVREGVAKGSVVNKLTRKQIRGRYLEFGEHTDSFVAVPVVHRGRIRGLIGIESAASGRFSDADVETLKDLAEPTGILLWKLDSYVHNHRHTEEAIGAFRASLHRMPTRLNPFKNAFIARPYEDGPKEFATRMMEIFESRGVRATDYAHKPGADMVMKDMEAQIAAAHFGIADLTDLNHNVLLELGMLIGNGKEVLLFRHHEDSRDLPFDLSGRHLYGYSLGRKDGVQLSEPSQSGCKAEELIDKFLNDMLANEAYKRARPWKKP